MKTKFFTVLYLLVFSLSSVYVHAQSNGEKNSVVKFSVWDPVGTNGKEAKEYNNTFSFNLLYGRSNSEKAFVFSGLATVVEKDAHGIQFAGLTNVIGGNANGLTISGIANIVGGNSNGLLFTGLVNIAENTKGVSVSGLANIAEDMNGLQFTGLGNIAENARGIQVAGLGNIAENMSGIQFAGLGNIAENINGIQVGGLGNIAQNVNGLQFGGLYNIAETVKGVQIGFLNVASHNDYPIGVINLIEDGEKGVAVTFDEMMNLMASFRSGGRVLYGIVGAGYNFDYSNGLLAIETGLGAHINCVEKFRINTEISYTQMTDCKHLEISRSALRVLPAFRFCDDFELFAGPSLNYVETNDAALYGMLPGGSIWDNTKSSGSKQQISIGYTIGLHYNF